MDYVERVFVHEPLDAESDGDPIGCPGGAAIRFF